MTQHTPGPWTVDECPNANGFHTIRLADGSEFGNTDVQPIATVYAAENARLIAVAPELLAAAAEVFNPLNPLDDNGEDVALRLTREQYDNLLAAVAKATQL